MIHGGHFGRYDSADDWGLNIDSLGKNFKVYAVDKIGQGFTDNPRSDGEYLIGSTVKHAFGFVKTLGLRNVNVVGHSRGG
ncbi:MAG: alpha/beta fold hydrolase [Nitrososphaerales archaeon]